MLVSEIINKIIEKRKFQSYLEIGVQNGVTYSAVKCNNKIGIDPAFIENYPHIGLAKTTSDDYFKNGCGKFDIVFIDGLHTYEQIKRDLNNSYNHLTDNGIILMHDVNPTTEIMARSHEWFIKENYQGEWCGDVWKIFEFMQGHGIDYFTFDIPYGLVMIDKNNPCNKNIEFINDGEDLINGFSYEYFDKNRNHMAKLYKEDYLIENIIC